MLSSLGLQDGQSEAGSAYDGPNDQGHEAQSHRKQARETSTDRVQSSDFLVKHSNAPRQIVENKGDQNTSLHPGDADDDSSSQSLQIEDAGEAENR